MEFKSAEIEQHWKTFWSENGVYEVSNDSDKPKYYILDMFPYPSGSGLHVGHPLGYIASDILSRYKRMKGFNVLHPMGYDAFGLPAEQYAIQTGVHPAKSTAENISRYRSQLDNLGFSFDWSREVQTCDPSYYKWTQWIFIQLFEHYYDYDADKAQPISALVARFNQSGTEGINAACSETLQFSASAWKGMSPKEQDDVLMNFRLAFRKVSYVNWCEALGTVLANDEVKDGVSERGGHPVERRAMLQWSLRTTAYAERLLNGLDTIDWSDSMKKMQTNWIGKSVGAQMFFDIEGAEDKIEIFTTRPDTIFGATFMVLAPEHELVSKLTTESQKEEVAQYLEYVNTRSERDRMSDVKSVTGAFIGTYAINPFTEEKIPIWIAEYVLTDYGTGAIMAVPSDDDRDFAFATKFNIPIIDIIDKSNYPGATRHDKLGVMINSGFLDGMEVPDAIDEIINRSEARGIGKKQINYRLRDASYSRQRYWGEPFPIIYDKDGVAHAMDVKDLPLELPELDDFQPAEGAQSPLARHKEWMNLPGGYTRETDTMPGFAGSSWYFLRYMDAHNDEAFASRKALDYWKDVDIYIGGTEHATGHLLYSRTWHKFLYDLGLVPVDEPFKQLVNQGMIQGVIESIYLMKDKKDGYNHFMCAKLAKAKGIEDYVKIPVHVDFVHDYGTEDSFLDTSSIKKFIDWRPEYGEAVFECSQGIFHKGIFTPSNGATENHLVTYSEVGKMSKSKFNVINPDDVVDQYGADCFRMYEMFLGPLMQAKPWNTNGIDGVSKFLKKFWYLFFDSNGQWVVTEEEPTKDELKILHQAIKKVTDDIERMSFNTCVSAFMVAVNELSKQKCNKNRILAPLVRLMAPFAPFMNEELWHRLGNESSVHLADYPVYEEKYLVEDSVTYPIAINGKTRMTVDFPSDASIKEVEKGALELEDLQKWIDGKTIRKVIVVPGRMVNIVVG
ncbi:MAG: leucine--tRNA ligase [Lewinellaceae bacterium]|nr:leucine--tRNA ligase [Lewinellaceae bacterium]